MSTARTTSLRFAVMSNRTSSVSSRSNSRATRRRSGTCATSSRSHRVNVNRVHGRIGVEATVAENVLQLGREALGVRAERLAEARGQGMDAVEWLGKQAQQRPIATTLTVTAAAAALVAGCALAVWALRR